MEQSIVSGNRQFRIADCGLRISIRSGRRSSRGVIYPLLLISILVIGVATAAVSELWSTEIKREKEEELIFRLGEFRQAIALYRTAHNGLPKELKDLLEDRTQLQTRRYLRRIYPDPFTGKADWKLDIMRDPSGVISGIQDLHSQAKGKPLKAVIGKQGKQVDSYLDW
jgi:type II secretory pathway pseudopilin PulG